MQIRKIREEVGMSLNELARRANISPGYLSDLERGEKQNPSVAIMKRISKVLGGTASEIFFEEKSHRKRIR